VGVPPTREVGPRELGFDNRASPRHEGAKVRRLVMIR
jgi:hypothetical protein